MNVRGRLLVGGRYVSDVAGAIMHLCCAGADDLGDFLNYRRIPEQPCAA